MLIKEKKHNKKCSTENNSHLGLAKQNGLTMLFDNFYVTDNQYLF